MENNALSYFLLAQGFVVLLILMVIAGLWLSYRNSRKRYLAIACVAGLLEVSRQVPDVMRNVFPESAPWDFLAILLQFFASVVFIYALIRIRGEAGRNTVLLISAIVLGFVVSIIAQFFANFPSGIQSQYLHSLPMLLVTACYCLLLLSSYGVHGLRVKNSLQAAFFC